MRSNTNARQELEGFVIRMDSRIKCADILLDNGDLKKIQLKVGYTVDEYKEFWGDLDFNYYSGYGGQELYGTVWFEDGTWMTRREYDGSEWWEHIVCPVIPEEIK